jgi:hypothetical protein
LLLQRLACAVALTIGAIHIASAQTAAPAVIELNATGEIQIAPDGHVTDYQLKSKLAPTVAELVDRTVRGWHFQPVIVDARAVNAKTTMSLRLHGDPKPDNSYSLRIESVHFGVLKSAQQTTPEYPSDAAHIGLGARVVLYLLINANGAVVEAIRGQTSLDMRARTESEAEVWRRRFEKASVKAALHWRYHVSEFVDGKPMASRYATAPIVFSTNRRDNDWTAYIPGPVHPAPWDKNKTADTGEQRFAQLSDGETASADSNFHLKDDVIGKTL